MNLNNIIQMQKDRSNGVVLSQISIDKLIGHALMREIEADRLMQALADSNLALMEQTELADKCRKQAETLEAERDQAREALEVAHARQLELESPPAMQTMDAAPQPAAAPESISKAFVTLESTEGRYSIVMKFNQKEDAFAVHDYLLGAGCKDYHAAPVAAAVPLRRFNWTQQGMEQAADGAYCYASEAQSAASQPSYFGISDEQAAIEAAKTLSMIDVPLNESGALNLCHAFLKLRKPDSERDAALEEAAGVCIADAKHNVIRAGSAAAYRCASEIRALKKKP